MSNYGTTVKNCVLATAHYLKFNIYNDNHNAFLYKIYSKIVEDNIYQPDDIIKTNTKLSKMVFCETTGTQDNHIILKSAIKDYVLTDDFVNVFMTFISDIKLRDDYLFAIKKEYKLAMSHAFKLFEYYAYTKGSKAKNTMPFAHFSKLIEIDSSRFGYYKSKGTRIESDMFGELDYVMSMPCVLRSFKIKSLNKSISTLYISDEIINKMNTANKKGSRPKWSSVQKVVFPIVKEFKPYVLVVDLNWHEDTDYCASIEMAAERGDEIIYTNNIYNVNHPILKTHAYKLQVRRDGELKDVNELGLIDDWFKTY